MTRVIHEPDRPLSYAQNMEDIHLAQIFAGQDAGFYIDIGAAHPVSDNVSLLNYLGGWRGIVVEPQAHLHRLYQALRPRDHGLDCLVGRKNGTAAFHEVDRLHGFSTTVESHARGAAAFGAAYRTVKRPVRTLSSICAEHAPNAIDWLKIDVEGGEADVLYGNDWSRFRPRVVLVEAVAPGSMEASHDDWEPILLEARYRFVFFDGLNRFYLAHEAHELAGRIPTVFQDWGSVRHLWDCGKAPDELDHPDHALASALKGLSMADLPLIDRQMMFSFLVKNMPPDELDRPASEAILDRFARLWLGAEPHRFDISAVVGRPLAQALQEMMACDDFLAALGRIAARYDGGFGPEE